MRNLILISLLFLSIQCFSQSDTSKKYNITLTEVQINDLYSLMEFSKANLQTSDASAKNVSIVIKAIQQFQDIISGQYKSQQPKKEVLKTDKK